MRFHAFRLLLCVSAILGEKAGVREGERSHAFHDLHPLRFYTHSPFSLHIRYHTAKIAVSRAAVDRTTSG